MLAAITGSGGTIQLREGDYLSPPMVLESALPRQDDAAVTGAGGLQALNAAISSPISARAINFR
jgi:hypothetical protein